ncbi:MAG: peptidylprolyl isomerase [Candidatus Bathyarchaeota archaeon]|nr:peptidylprolyl isomerase [Candidatus Bathyarchaeota archaeon]
MALQKGDFILIDYVAKVKETNEVFDTTKDEVAKKEHLHKEGEIYEPKLVVVGEGWVLKALDDALLSAEVGKAETVEIPSDKAFGPRDPEKIRRVPIKQLFAKQINPVVGARIEFQGKNATIRSIGAGRVLLDFNPALAGRTLIYDLTVNKKIDEETQRIAALIHRRVPVVEEDKFKVTVKAKNLSIEMPEDTFYVEGIQIAKRGISMDIQRFFPDMAETKFVETFKYEPKPEAAAPAAPAESAPVEEKKQAPAEVPAAEEKPKAKKASKAKPEAKE